MLRFTGVRGGGEGQHRVVRRLPAGIEQADRLQRLVRRTGEDGGVDGADRLGHRAVRTKDDDGAGVRALDDARADQLDEDRQAARSPHPGGAVGCWDSSDSTSASPSR